MDMPRSEPAAYLAGATDRSGESSQSAVSWAAIFYGAVTAAAVSLILVALGSALGLRAVSPWSGASATSFTVVAAIWLIITQWLAAGFGGYLTGRLRTKWVATHTHEVFFRDTAHGLVAWALATVLTAALLVSAGVSMAAGGARVAGAAGASAAMAGPLLMCSRQIRYRPLAMTIPPPMYTRLVGNTPHTTRSMRMPHNNAVYSKGATTEGGAVRNASVSRCCAIAEKTPIPASKAQSSRRIGTHPGAAMMRASTVISAIIQKTTLAVESVRVMMRSAIALNAYPVAESSAATAPSETKLDADGCSMVNTPTKPMQMAAQRRHSICSPSKGTDSAVTIRGAARNIAYASARESARTA